MNMPDVTSLLADHIYMSLNQTEKITVSLLQSLKAQVMQYKKSDHGDQPIFSRFLGLNYLLIFLFFPCYLFYWCYVYPAHILYTSLSFYLRLPIKVLRKRSHLLNALICHISEILSIADLIINKVISSKVSELLAFCICASIEISLATIWPFQQQQPPVHVSVTPEKNELDLPRDISELVAYQELAPDENAMVAAINRKSSRVMHNYIPCNPFRATIRIKRPPSVDTQNAVPAEGQRAKPSFQRIKHSYSNTTLDNAISTTAAPLSTTKLVVKLLRFIRKLPSSLLTLMLKESSAMSSSTSVEVVSSKIASPLNEDIQSVTIPDIDIFNIDSPASFPASPFSRAYVINRASERVVSTLFAARDRLRLEAQSVSRDEYSRMAAREAQSHGQFAVFDSRQVSAGIALTCGNHCAVKVGKGLVSSCRAMIPIRPNAFVYFEVSVTVSSNQVPHLAIGLAPLDSPLNVMVGSWTNSLGLYYDGQVMVGSRWFPPLPCDGSQTSSSSSEKLPAKTDAASVQTLSSAISADYTSISAGSTVGILIYLPGVHEGQTSSSQELQHPELACPPPSLQNRDRSVSSASHASSRSRTVSMAAATAMQLSHPLVHFNINGQPISFNSDVQVALNDMFVNNGALQSPPLYPTVSLFTEDTRVWCRFCEADIVYRDRSTIRAPLGARVYCLDGSLLLSERE